MNVGIRRRKGYSLPVTGGWLPASTVTIPPGEKLQFAAAYEGCRPSTEEEDIVFTVTFTENDVTGEPLTAEAKLTSVELQMTAVYEASENPNPSRHIYGVGEKVRFRVAPVVPRANLRVVKADDGDNVTDYDTFGYDREIAVSGVDVYQCPATDTIPDVTLRYMGVEYRPSMTVVEPQSVEALSVSREGTFSLGDVCMGVMVSRVYVKPYTVSFI